MFITSREHFVDCVTATAERAKKWLARDRDLVPVLLFQSPDALITHALIGRFEAADVTSHVRGMIRKRGNLELVVYITPALAITDRQFKRLRRVPVEHPKAMQVIRVEGSHRDFGDIGMHIEFTRGDAGFTFKPVVCTQAVTVDGKPDPVLKDLWPKRKLNS